jgi:hypothetical protein
VKLGSLTLREHRLRVFEDRVLTRIIGPKRKEQRGWRKMHNEKLYNLFFSPGITVMSKHGR